MFKSLPKLVVLCFLLMLALNACGAQNSRTVVTSEPSGARISLNGRDVGLTPCNMEIEGDSSVVDYNIKSELEGYRANVKMYHGLLFQAPREVIPPHIHFVMEPAD